MKRLSALADLVPACTTVADIGCDHGLLAALLIEHGIAKRAIACDISAPSLQKTVRLAAERALPIETRLGDGLTVLEAGEADCAVIAGMGGLEILRILTDPRRIDGIERFVVGPHSELPAFRAGLYRVGLRIAEERYVRERNKTYCLMRLEPGTERYSEAECEFGLSYRTPPPELVAEWDRQIEMLERKSEQNPAAEPLLRALARLKAVRNRIEL